MLLRRLNIIYYITIEKYVTLQQFDINLFYTYNIIK